jgi:hypothetical protein
VAIGTADEDRVEVRNLQDGFPAKSFSTDPKEVLSTARHSECQGIQPVTHMQV